MLNVLRLSAITLLTLSLATTVHGQEEKTSSSSRMTLSADVGRHYQRISPVIDELNILESPFPDLAQSYMLGVSIAKTDNHLIQRLSAGLTELSIILQIPRNDFLLTASSTSQQYAYLSYAVGKSKRFGASKLGYEITAGLSAFLLVDEDAPSPENWPSGNYQGRDDAVINFQDARLEETPASRFNAQIQAALTYPIMDQLDISIWSTGMAWLNREYRTTEMNAIVSTIDGTQSRFVKLTSYMPAIAWGLRVSVNI